MSTEIGWESFTAKRSGLLLALILAAVAIFASGAWVGHRAWAQDGQKVASATKQKPAQKVRSARSQDASKAERQPAFRPPRQAEAPANARSTRKDVAAKPAQKTQKPRPVDKQPQPLSGSKPGRYGTATIEL